MQIARLFASAALFGLAACDGPKPEPTLPSPPTAPPPVATTGPTSASATSTAAPPSPPVEASSSPDPKPPEAAGSRAAKEGEMCGGFAGIPCEKGYVCTNVMPVADGAGTCRKGKK